MNSVWKVIFHMPFLCYFLQVLLNSWHRIVIGYFFKILIMYDDGRLERHCLGTLPSLLKLDGVLYKQVESMSIRII